MKSRTLQIVCIALLQPYIVESQVNFSEHIAPIVYENCTTCHRPGEVGPMSFTNYEEVAAWGNTIDYVSSIKYMPPFPPDVDFATYVGERSLTDEEIQLITEWVAAGMPQGDPSLEPTLPNFPTGSQIGIPDLVLEMSEAYTIEGNNLDDYRVFVLPTGLLEDTEISAIEFRAGNTRAVHHAVFALDVTGEAAILDDQSPGYGYEAFGGFLISEEIGLTWGYVPGTAPLVYPVGIGEIIPAGADLLIQVHYAPLSTDEIDQSSVNIFFKDQADPIERPVQIGSVSPYNLSGGFNSFIIPPNEITTFFAESIYSDNSASFGIDEDISLISVDPHSHYLGKSFEIFVVSPQNDTINLLKIDDWDFNWQGAYTFDRMKKIPANSQWFTKAIYDNTVNNPNNPSNPPVYVTWGEGSLEEMLLVGFYYVPYEEGDEDIEIGANTIFNVEDFESPTNSELFVPTPNPSNGQFVASFELKESELLSFELTSMDGKFVQQTNTKKRWSPGRNTLEINLTSTPSGIYLFRMKGAGYILTKKIIIVE